jgi:hypothetical protein
MFWLTLATTDGRSQKFSGNCKDPAAKGARNADPRAADYLLYQFLSRARDTISAAQLPGAAAALNSTHYSADPDRRQGNDVGPPLL